MRRNHWQYLACKSCRATQFLSVHCQTPKSLQLASIHLPIALLQSTYAVTPRTLVHVRGLVSCLICKKRKDFDACPAACWLVMWARTYSKEVLMDNASPPQLATLSDDCYRKDGSFASHTGIDCGGCSSTSWCDTENEAWIKWIDFVSQGRKEGWRLGHLL